MCVKWVLIVILFTRNYHTAQLIYHFLYTTQHQAAASQTQGSSQASKKDHEITFIKVSSPDAANIVNSITIHI